MVNTARGKLCDRDVVAVALQSDDSTVFATGSRPSQDTRMARALQIGVRLRRVGFAHMSCRARPYTRGDQRRGRGGFCGREGFVDADYMFFQPF